METLNSNRIYKLDNIKFFLIIFVVIGHIADYFADMDRNVAIMRFIIYTFHMPAFIFISGLLGKRNIKEKRYLNIFSYLTVYLFIKILQFALDYFPDKKVPSFTLFADMSTPWYIFALFGFSLITIAIDKISPRYILILSVIIGCLAGYDKTLGDKFVLLRILVYYPFYYAGYISDPQKVCKFTSKKKLIPAALAIIAALISVSVIFYDKIYKIKFIFTGRNPYSAVYDNCYYGFALRLICYAVSTLVIFALFVLIPEKIGKGFLSKIGSNTLQIYALHLPIANLILRLLNKKLMFEKMETFVLFILILTLTFVITAFCALPFWKKVFKVITRIPLKEE